MPGDTQDEPIQAQHDTTESDKVAGILLQQEADLAGHEEADVLQALRQRLTEGGHEMSDETLAEHARRIAALDTNDFSKK